MLLNLSMGMRVMIWKRSHQSSFSSFSIRHIERIMSLLHQLLLHLQASTSMTSYLGGILITTSRSQGLSTLP
uniref:Uncharacterized protein LOC105115419 isoform X3 n=1 Tax=Rhizophora mucronata TaxID=61149 RepID=A0A2P2J113_RHIMU